MYWNLYFLVVPPFGIPSNITTAQNQPQVHSSFLPKPSLQNPERQSENQGIQINLTAKDLREAGYNNTKKAWTEDEDALILRFSKKNKLSWKQIAQKIPGRTSKMCYSRYRRLICPLKQQWTQAENEKIKELVQEFQFNWKKISQSFKNRNPKQIKEHYENYLEHETEKKAWVLEEDLKLIQMVRKYGTNWAAIQAHMQGRIKCQIKNRYYGHLKRLEKRKSLADGVLNPNN